MQPNESVEITRVDKLRKALEGHSDDSLIYTQLIINGEEGSLRKKQVFNMFTRIGLVWGGKDLVITMSHPQLLGVISDDPEPAKAQGNDRQVFSTLADRGYLASLNYSFGQFLQNRAEDYRFKTVSEIETTAYMQGAFAHMVQRDVADSMKANADPTASWTPEEMEAAKAAVQNLRQPPANDSSS